MYWFRAGGWLNILPWLVVMLLVFWGGWLLVFYVFKKRQPEHLYLGFSLGIIVYLALINLLGRWVEPETVFWLCGVITLLVGVIAARFNFKLPYLAGLRASLPYLVLFVGMFWVFLRIGKGVGLFDEYKNLALVSVIANGEIPVREFFGIPNPLRYHYGFHFLPASMMQLGNMMPWSAFDMAKALLWGLLAVLSWMLGNEFFKKDWGGPLATLTVLFSSGTRYLLLLLPSNLLIRGNEIITLWGASSESAESFFSLMTSQSILDSGPPVPFPMAYMSGVKTPLVLGHAGNTLMSVFILLVLVHLLLDFPGGVKGWRVGILTVLLSFWGLTAEAAYVVFLIATGTYVGWVAIRDRTFKINPFLREIVLGLLISLPLVIFQGGTISAMLLNHANDFNLVDAAQTGSDLSSFSTRWPPAIISAHLGQIPLDNGIGWIIGLFETGVWLVLLPFVSFYKETPPTRFGKHLFPISLIIVWFSLLLPLFVRWEWERDIVRIPTFGLEVYSILLLFFLSGQLRKKTVKSRVFSYVSLGLIALTVFGGFVLMGTQLTASQQLIYSHRYDIHDGELLSEVWGMIPEDSKAIGPIGKMSILTGHLTGGIYTPPPGEEGEVWDEMRARPTIEGLVSAGYEYVYADQQWFAAIPESAQAELDADCVSILSEAWNKPRSKFTRIYDLTSCAP